MFIAFDLPDSTTRNDLLGALWDKRIVALSVGEKSVRFRPALIFSKENVEEVVGGIENWLKEK